MLIPIDELIAFLLLVSILSLLSGIVIGALLEKFAKHEREKEDDHIRSIVSDQLNNKSTKHKSKN